MLKGKFWLDLMNDEFNHQLWDNTSTKVLTGHGIINSTGFNRLPSMVVIKIK